MSESAIARDIDTRDLEKLGEGAFGECFRTKDGKVYKEFFRSMEKFESDIVKLSQLSIGSYVFPTELVYYPIIEFGNLKGYMMEYVTGNELYNLPFNTDMNKLLEAICILEKDTNELSSELFQIKDMKGGNTYFTPDNKIVVIDTDLFTYISDADIENLKNGNMQEIAYLISTAVIKRNERHFKSSRLLKLYNDCYYGNVNPSCFVYEIMEEMRRSNEEVKTYKDFYHGMKLIMR